MSLFYKAWQVKNLVPPAHPETPFVTVIVAAHNEDANLKSLIPILLNQNYPNYEVIISLDRCGDGSLSDLQKIKSEKLTYLDLKEVPTDWNPKKYAIKQAVDTAKGDWLLLTDADCRATKNWIKEMAQGMEDDSGFVLGLSPYQKKSGLLNHLIQYETFFTSLEFIQKAIFGNPYMGLGRNLAYRKSLFEKVNGFEGIQNVTGGDDDLLVQKMARVDRGSVVLSQNSWVESIPEEKWSSYFSQKTRHYSVGKYYPSWVKRSESLRWFFQILFWVLFALSIPINASIALLIFAFHYTIRIISINIVADRLEKRFNHLWLPFVDLVYSVVLPIISLRSLLVKNVKWN